MDVGKKIEFLLKKKGMTRKELAEKSGITEAAICRYINGSRKPKTVCLNSLAQAFGVPVNQLIDTSEFLSNDIDDAIKLIARNAHDISPDQKKSIINALIGD